MPLPMPSQRLLKTTLNDTDRLILLKARIKNLENTGDITEIMLLWQELAAVHNRLEYFAEWSIWSD